MPHSSSKVWCPSCRVFVLCPSEKPVVLKKRILNHYKTFSFMYKIVGCICHISMSVMWGISPSVRVNYGVVPWSFFGPLCAGFSSFVCGFRAPPQPSRSVTWHLTVTYWLSATKSHEPNTARRLEVLDSGEKDDVARAYKSRLSRKF